MKTLGSLKFGPVEINFLSNSAQMTVAELTFGPEDSAPLHAHEQEEINYVLEGIFEIRDGEQVHICRKGDIIDVASGKEHNITNISKNIGKVLTIWSPSRKDFIEKLTEKNRK